MPPKQYNLRSSPKPREPIHATRSPKPHETMQKNYSNVESEEENGTDLEDEDMDITDSSYKSHKSSVNRSLNSSKEHTPEKARKTPQNRQYKSGDKQDDHEQDTPDSIKKQKLERPINKVKSEKSNNTYCGSYFLFVACFLALVGVICFHISDETSTPPDNRNLLEKFNADMKDFQSMFPAQSRRFLKIIRVSLKRIIVENNPDYPAILLLVAPSGSKSSATGTCIAKQLTKNMNTLFNVTSARVINIPNDIRHNNPDDEKKDLDNKIKDSFQHEHIRSLAVDHFEQLSPRASLLFHGYCDGDNAPFKNVAIVFILHTELDKDVLQQDSRLIDDHLRKLWSSSEYPLDQDKIDPLIARVANNAAVITEEENLKC
ncbi:torsin-1A-interacting protein 2-like [Mytilus californianus]|uniref:torsin-1A-interacting protein 2-like n=1 Tax=Mytilus californianus TaxID=6549 RepID=UPI00224537D0|nr:torsin-1A-interacting protein 2-like [Mytilus californianus]XP_052091620.1 torsin-1A-interacting protein 2-like [Mytilus californianus]